MPANPKRIRPAARLLNTIGKDLIKDVYAAIVELVKNAYDADSPNAFVKFKYKEDQKILVVAVEDQGHGMTYDTVVNRWLVPATSDKLKRKRSEKGRMLQGRKGIGRFAATILGERMIMETTTNGMTTSLILDMEELNKVEFLDEFELDVVIEETGKPDGTLIEIEKENVHSSHVKKIWNPRQLRKLFVELRSLTAPEEVFQLASEHGFDISRDTFDMELLFEDFPVDGYGNKKIVIDPFPVLDLFDYKISGVVDRNGNATLLFENQNLQIPPEKVSIKTVLEPDSGQVYPGDIFVDLRVYDRDSDSIGNFIKRGLKDLDTGDFLGKNEARKILDESYGVGIYREQFRIRPYGEQDFDWLDLDKKRVQKPTYFIGHNQIIGFVNVRQEEVSGLEEKSARDGLVENGNYFGLVSVVDQVINELAIRRVRYRKKAKKGGRARDLEDDLNLIFDFEDTKEKISKGLDKIGITQKQKENIDAVVTDVLKKEKEKKSEYARNIRETIALYQGQVTLGKITHVLLHEGRKHIKYISETLPRIRKWIEMLDGEKSDLKDKIDERSDKVIIHTTGLSRLFKKIEPLARTKRPPKRRLSLEREMENCFEIYSSDIKDKDINVEINFPDGDIEVVACDMDVITLLSNLIENSVYWLGHNQSSERKIEVEAFKENNEAIVEFFDTGPGFQGDNLDFMFEPGYSMKPDGAGTGLGLSLAGEAMYRIGGRLEAKKTDSGAMFELIFEGT